LNNPINNTDDWTRNWQRRIAVRITSIVLWSLGFVCLGVVAIFISKVEKGVELDYQKTLDRIAYHTISLLNQTGVWDSAALIEKLNSNVMGELARVDISTAKGQVSNGLSPFAEESTTLLVPFVWRDGAHDVIKVVGTHLSKEQTIRKRQVQMVLVFGGSIILFGLALTWVIDKNVRRPFEVLIGATQSFSNGARDVRVDLDRFDEFGVLANFFNDMLTKVQENEASLNREVNEKQQAYKALQEHRDHLEEIVKERTAELEVAHDQAMAASNAKSSFLANMSHEIRTPLTAIIGFAETLLDHSVDNKVKLQASETIMRSGRHLLGVINDVLDLSKIEANRLDIEVLPVNLFQLVTDVASVIELQAEGKSLQFEVVYQYPLPAKISTDPTRLKQVLLNILSNAVKFTDHGGVRVEVSYLPDDARIKFAIIDSGIGLKPDQVEKLFTPFVQGDSSTNRRYGGTGLGLHISRQLAEMMGGGIRIESSYGLGSRFEVIIDAGHLSGVHFVQGAHEITVETTTLSSGGVPTLSGRVLLAEDNIDNQHLISLLIRKTGAIVDIVNNGQEAVTAISKQQYDLVLMDIQMPTMDGMQATEVIRLSGNDIPIVALTANVMKDDVDKYMSIGFTGHLSKPIEQVIFYRTLASYCAASGAQNTAESVSPVVDVQHRVSDVSSDFQNPMLEDADFGPLVLKFLKGLPEVLSCLTSAVRNEDWLAVLDYAHSIKGSAGNFGYHDLTRFATDLETQARSNDVANVPESYDRLLAHANKILALHG
jgi:signal transduction histidine kinase/CheY-like chemotaxis protein/HPt (histidine-containing phosphotransfer) domain-containing protein